MKLKYKLLAFMLAMSVSIPTFAMVKIEDTFTYGNIGQTIIGGENKSIITSDNTIMGNGSRIHGVNSSVTNTNGKWLQTVTGSNGNPLTNIVKIAQNFSPLYALDSFGNAYYIDSYPEKINLGDNIKVKDIGITYNQNISSTAKLICYLITEDGDVYKGGKGTTFTKVESIENAESITTSYSYRSSSGSSITNTAIILTKEKEVFYADYNGNVGKLEGVTDVTRVFGGLKEFYFQFSSGRFGRAAEWSNKVDVVNVPEGERVLSMFGSSYDFLGLVTDKGTYRAVGTNLTSLNLVDATDNTNKDIKIVTGNWGTVIDSNGDYYDFVVSGTTLKLTPITGIDKWCNDNPIVFESELANFDIPLNEVYKREDDYSFTFNLVTNENPTKFNIYYVKTENRNNKEKWVKIGDNVSVDTLNKRVYDTGYIDSKGRAITGFSYTYNWRVGNEDLVGVHLIVEPVYN